MTPAISTTAIVPTFNRAGYIADTINAILVQSRPPAAVIVIDDGSTDGTADVVRTFGARVAYHRQENAGKAVALNAALKLVETDAVWICDDDDVPVPQALEWLSAALEAHSDCGFSYGFNGHLEHKEAGWQTIDAELPPRLAEPFALQALRRSLVYQPGLLVRRHCYAAVGPFDVSLLRSQDYDMLLRLARHFPSCSVERIVFHQRVHDGVRGPANAQSSAADRQRVWLGYDQQIFRKVYRDYPLSAFAGGGSSDGGGAGTRRALTTRAAIMARRGLWQLAADDLSAALSSRDEGVSFDATDRANMRSIFDWAGYGLQTIEESGPFFAAIARAPMARRWTIIRQMMLPLWRRAKRIQSRGDARAITAALNRCVQALAGRAADRVG